MVRIKGRAGIGSIAVGGCYGAPDLGQSGLILTNLLPIPDFNQPNICWKDDSAGHKHTRRFLECVDDSFLLQVIEEPMRRGVLLNLFLSYKEDLMRNVNLKGGVGCSDHEVVKILRTMRKMHSKLATLDFRRAELALFGDVVGRVPWNKALEGRGA